MAFNSEEQNQRRAQREKQRQSYYRQMKWLKAGLIVTACVLVLCGGVLLAASQGWLTPGDNTAASQPTETAPTEQTQPQVPDTVIHLVAGGDLNITDKVVASGVTDGGYDYTEAFLDVMPILASADLSILNFEGNLYGAPYGSETTSAPDELMQALGAAGVDVIQTANSSTLNNGLLGLRQTLSGIAAAGMMRVGSYADSEDFEKYEGFLILEVQGIRIALVSFTKGMDGKGLPEGSEDCVNLLYTDYSSTYQKVDTDGITKVLRAAQAQQPDITIALLHWGSEYNDQISSSQKKICTLMSQEGVDAIIGTHSHYVQQMGFDEETGMFIAYCLGDFFGDGETAGTEYSVLLDLEITRDGDTGDVTLTGYDYTPIYTCEGDDGKLRILRIREAMEAYNSNNIHKISQEIYSGMAYALTRIEARTAGK